MITKTFLAGLLLLLPFSAGALGLGGISVDSFLDEPLNAHIELVAPDLVEVDDIRVSLAEPAAFEKSGLERPFLLSQLMFTPKIGEDGRVLIQVASRQAVREPYLNFLVQVRWPGGRLLKEYTVLLDPPSYRPPAGSVVEPVAKSVSGAVEQTTQQDGPATYGPVRSSETLWAIAQNTRPDRSLSVEQMMLALQRRNPTAFQRGNVNLLKQGVVLEIPGRGFIAELSDSEARARFMRQTRDWRSMRNRAAGGSGLTSAARQEQKEAANGEHPQATPIQPKPGRVMQEVGSGKVESERLIDRGENQLEVVEPAGEWRVGDHQAATAYTYPSDDAGRLRGAIADSKQDLLAVREINRDLEKLQNILEIQIQALRDSLDEKDQEISRLMQHGATTEVQPAGVTGGRGSEITRNADPRSAPRKDDNRVRKAAVTEPIPHLAAPEPTATPLQAVFRWMQDNWMLLLVVSALLLLLMARVRRRQPVAATNHEVNSFRSYTELDQDLSGGVTSNQALDSFQSYADEQGLFPEAGEDAASILTKADIYLAYRQYDQAVSLVTGSITDNPGDWMLKAKLLEIYAFRKDKTGFIHLLEEVHDSMAREEPEIWAKVVAMGQELVPDHRLISASGMPGEQGLDSFVDELLATEGALASSVVTENEGLHDDMPLLEMGSGLYQKSNRS